MNGAFVRRAAVVFAALALAGSIGASSASASASTCAGFGPHYKFVTSAYFCSTINGSGTYVSTIQGFYGYTFPGMNYNCLVGWKADFYDSNGNWYTWRWGGQNGGCQGMYNISYGLPTIPIYSTMRSGWVRLSLMSGGSNGNTIAQIWFSIHP